jgi:hypothetical protein
VINSRGVQLKLSCTQGYPRDALEKTSYALSELYDICIKCYRRAHSLLGPAPPYREPVRNYAAPHVVTTLGLLLRV